MKVTGPLSTRSTRPAVCSTVGEQAGSGIVSEKVAGVPLVETVPVKVRQPSVPVTVPFAAMFSVAVAVAGLRCAGAVEHLGERPIALAASTIVAAPPHRRGRTSGCRRRR